MKKRDVDRLLAARDNTRPPPPPPKLPAPPSDPKVRTSSCGLECYTDEHGISLPHIKGWHDNA